MSEKPAGASTPAETNAAPVWQSSPPGSIYDLIQVASFALGPDGRVTQWSDRVADLLGVPAERAMGRDPVEVFMPPELWALGHRRVAELLDGREWTGLVPYRIPDADGRQGLAEVFLMPADTQHGERTAHCIVVDVGAMRQIETDLAAAQAVFGQSPLGFFLFDTGLQLLRVNDRFADVFGRPADWHRGRTVYDFLSRPEADRFTAALRRVLETGEPVSGMQLKGPAQTGGDRPRWSASFYQLHSGSGRLIGVAGLIVDVTGRRRAEQEAAGVRRNLALLNEAGARIGSSLDLETTARELLAVAVPQFCDLASVDLYQGLLVGDESPPGLLDGSAELRRVAFASAVSDGPVDTGAASVVAGRPPREGNEATQDGAGGGTGGALENGELVQVGEVHRYPPQSPCARALSTARARVVPGRDADDGPELGAVVQSTLVVPMVARDSVVGLAQFSRTKGSEPFGERDRALAVELAARAAVFVDNARLYRREHERALILQRSLLPPGDPEAAGLDIACRYLPGSEATEVGGDWFDVIELPGHRTALVVGDVMGRGLRAAVAMGELRTAVRTLALQDVEPAEVLTALDEIARGLGATGGARASRSSRNLGGSGDLAEVYLATCVYAVYDSVTRRCSFANAGHLPPVLVEPGGESTLLEFAPGLPLGVGGEPFEETEIELPDGALLALYTDGLVESRDHALEDGLRAFRTALAGSPLEAPARPAEGVESGAAYGPERPGPLEGVCDHVLNALNMHHGEDDIALLMARVQGLPATSVGDWRLPVAPRSVGRARELARAQLLSWGLDTLVDTTELLVSELVTNALRYGELGMPPAKSGGELRLRLLLDRTLVCEVWDGGLVQPRRRRARDTDEGGRGLQLVGLLSAAWGSRRTPRGKTVWFELGLPDGDTPEPDSVEALLSLF